jgi:hypothetical protein
MRYFLSVMAGHSRLKDGVASARLCPAIHVFLAGSDKDVDARDKPGHDEVSRAQKPYVAIGVGMVRNARVTCQNNCRLIASATEWAVPGRMMNWRSPFGSRL